MLTGTCVSEIDSDRKVAITSDGQEISFQVAVVSTGSSGRSDSSSKSTAFHLGTLGDFRRLKEALDSTTTKDIVITGNGFAACELAASLSKSYPSRKVILQTSSSSGGGPLDSIFPKYLSDWTRQKLESFGIRVGDDDVGAIDDAIHVDTILVPTIPKGLPVRAHGIAFDATLQVNPGIFAAGDIITASSNIGSFDNAVESGKFAGANAVKFLRSQDLLEYRHIPMFW